MLCSTPPFDIWTPTTHLHQFQIYRSNTLVPYAWYLPFFIHAVLKGQMPECSLVLQLECSHETSSLGCLSCFFTTHHSCLPSILYDDSYPTTVTPQYSSERITTPLTRLCHSRGQSAHDHALDHDFRHNSSLHYNVGISICSY